jgi:PAS domain S-box-containing protein
MADMPIIYCSEPFEELTGYSSSEILGRNCRFLQIPPEGHQPDQSSGPTNETSRKELREKLAKGEEARVRLVNYRKDGQMFVNVLTTIPISWEEGHGEGKRYIVGFQADEGHYSHDRV